MMSATTACDVTAAAIAALVIQAGALWALGRPFLCARGEFKLWEGDASSPCLSQHLTDWYSFTHIIHGVLFYFLVWLAAPGLSVAQRFLIVLAVEVGWGDPRKHALRHPPLSQAAAGAGLRRRQHRQFACRYAGDGAGLRSRMAAPSFGRHRNVCAS